MKIVMPHSVRDGMLQMVTREGDSHRPGQKVKDILGKQVGRVPGNLCCVFQKLLQRQMMLGSVVCH